MQAKSISSQIRASKQSKNTKLLQINYEKLINKQREIISSLNDEILLLKSYITITKQNTSHDGFCQVSSIINTSTSSLENTFNKELEESFSPLKNSQKFYKEIIEILELKDVANVDEIMIVQKIRKLKQICQTKQQPIFIQRIKEIKMPITIQKIVERIVQKPVQKIVEKIIYIQRDHHEDKYSKNNQYRQSEKYDQHTVDRSYNSGLNRTVSQKNFRKDNLDNTRQEKIYKPKYDSKYQPKIQYKNEGKYQKYSNVRKVQGGGNLVKKRSQVGFNNNKYTPYKNNDYY